MKEQITIVKVGGNVIDNDPYLSFFLESFAALSGPKILVHGGGKLATTLAEQMHIPQQVIEGRRITDAATLKVVTMVYAGYINKNITAQLQALGCNAFGLSGADGNLLQAHQRKRAGLDYGFAGDVDIVNTHMITGLLQLGLSLVVAPITHNAKGQLLNTNADTIAREIAQAMSLAYDTRLVYCFEKAGVLRDITDEGSVISVLQQQQVQSLTEEGILTAGMLPKISNAFAALGKGVQQVIIGKWDQLPGLLEGQSGTRISYE